MESWLADQKPTIENFKNIWRGTYIYHAIILGIILSVASWWVNSGVMGVLIYALFFTAFDCLGWRLIIMPFIDTAKRVIENYNAKIISCENLDSEDSKKTSFKELCKLNQAETLETLNNAKAAYRSMQTMFQWLMFIPVYLVWGHWSVLGCVIVWWFGFDDLLYYILLKIPAKLEDRYEWLESWTVHLIHRKPVYGKLFISFSIAGLILGVFLGYI